MTDEQGPAAEIPDPEKTHVLVRGDCDHVFPVPLARLADGADFTCPACGQVDRLDEEAVIAAKDELETLRAKGPLNELSQLVSNFFSRSEAEKK